MFKTTLLTICALLGIAKAGSLGATASLDIAVVEQAKDTYFAVLLQALNNLKIPDFTSDDGTLQLHDNVLHVSQQTSDVQFTNDPTQNSVSLRADHLTAKFNCGSFRAQEWIFIATGQVEVDLNDIDIGLGFEFGTQTLADGSIVPNFQSVNVVVDIDRENLDIHISGNIWTDIVSWFEVFFKGPVADLIQDTTENVLNSVGTYTSMAMATTDGRAAIPGFPKWIVDFQTPVAPEVTETTLGFGVKGIMYDTDIGEDEWPVDFPDIPFKTADYPAELQVFVSTDSINSVTGSFLEVQEVAGWVNATTVVNGTALNTTCGTFDAIFSGLSKTYGEDTPVNLFIKLTKLGQFTTSKADQDIKLVVAVDFAFYVETADQGEVLALQLLLDQMTVDASVTITDFLIGIAATKFQVGNINVETTTIGKISTFTIKTLINTGFAVILPILNKFLEKLQLRFPDNILGIFTLSDLNLAYYDDYIYFGATPTFLPPTVATF